MSETDTELDARLDAVERALTDDGTDLADVRDAAALSTAVDDLEARVADLEATVEELDAAVQAVRGYAGNVRAVNREVERRASAALAKAEALESSVERRHNREEGAFDADADPAADPDPAADGRRRDAGERRSLQSADQSRCRADSRPRRSCTRVDRRCGNGRPPARTDDLPRDGERSRDGDDHCRRDADERREERADRPRSRLTGQFRRDDEGRERERGRADDGDESGRAGGTNGDDGSETEQFIERVRDAL